MTVHASYYNLNLLSICCCLIVCSGSQTGMAISWGGNKNIRAYDDHHTIRWVSICVHESQGGNPIGKMLVILNGWYSIFEGISRANLTYYKHSLAQSYSTQKKCIVIHRKDVVPLLHEILVCDIFHDLPIFHAASLTFDAINVTTRHQFWLLCMKCMWFHTRIGQNCIGENILKLYRSYHYFILDWNSSIVRVLTNVPMERRTDTWTHLTTLSHCSALLCYGVNKYNHNNRYLKWAIQPALI